MFSSSTVISYTHLEQKLFVFLGFWSHQSRFCWWSGPKVPLPQLVSTMGLPDYICFLDAFLYFWFSFPLSAMTSSISKNDQHPKQSLVVIITHWCFCDLHWLFTKVLISYSIGRPKHRRVMAGALEGDIFIGQKAEASSTHKILKTINWLIIVYRELTKNAKYLPCYPRLSVYQFNH